MPLPNLLVSDLFCYDPLSSSFSWNQPLLNYLFTSTSVREILKTSFSFLSQEKHIWTPSSNGSFSTKSAHKLVCSQRVSTASSPFSPSQWKLLWKLNLNDRLKLFLWKIAWDIVPSRIRLNQVFPINPASLVCPLCKVAEDSLHHLFFSCFFARISWRTSPWPLDSLKWTSLSLSDWIKGILTPHSLFGIPLADSYHFQIYVAVFCDLMWFYRNQAVHNGILPEVSKLAAHINHVSLEHLAAWTSKLSPLRELWSPPPPDFFKINFDTAIRDDFSSQAAVCRNSSGKIIKILV
jgi:hypothetical protein